MRIRWSASPGREKGLGSGADYPHDPSMLTASPPNLLVILTDQQTHDALSCAGNLDVQTPNLDRLAAQGTRFTRAFVPFPVCVPSRTSLQYGAYPHQVQFADQEMVGRPLKGKLGEVRPEWKERELGHRLRKAGYRCGWAGKWHVGTWGATESLGHGTESGFDPVAPIDDAGLPSACEQFLGVRDDRPFCLVASFDNPHNIHEWQIDVPLPWGNLPEPPPVSQLPPLPLNHGVEFREPAALRAYRSRRPVEASEEVWRRYRWAYFQLVEKVDRQIGKVLDALESSGKREETLVIMTSDHGELAGAHSLPFKHALYEESVRVPLLIAGPDVPVGVREDLVCNMIDLHATLLASAGIDPAGIDGCDLRELAREEKEARDHVVVTTRFHNGCRARLIRDTRWAYVIYEWGPITEQLFDCATDPGQRVDLATCARFDDVKKRLKQQLRAWMVAHDDTFIAGHYTHPDVEMILPGDDY